MLKSDLDKGSSLKETELLKKHKLYAPSDVLTASVDENLDLGDYDRNIGMLLKELGREQGGLSKGKSKSKDMERINELIDEQKTIQKYRDRIGILEEGKKTLGKGFHKTQPKQNTYKIKRNGQYGGLMIDIPTLLGQLHVVAIKDGPKVIDRQIDFDTIDLLTKRFNSKKQYSPLSKMVFEELNMLS